MNNKEQLAKEYADKHSIYESAWDDTYHGFLGGFSAKQKETEKTITDTLNKYKSYLQQETHSKLGKVIDNYKVTVLQAKISALEEVKRKLK